MEIIVVDGMSDDGTREVLAEYQRKHPELVRVLDNPKRVVPSAMNIGIKAARGEIIVRLDAHAYYQNDYIAQCVEWLERSGADNVGGTCLVEPTEDTLLDRAVARSIAHPFGSGNAHHKTSQSREPRYVDTVAFGCFRKELFDRIGYFREDMARSQDIEFNNRLRRNGGKILWVPHIKSRYQARSGLRRIIPYYFSNGFWVLFPLKFGVAAFRPRHLVPFAFVAWLLATALLSPWFFWSRIAFFSGAAAYACAAFLAAIHVALVERRLEYLFTLPPAFFLLHAINGVGTGYAGLCLLLERILPKGSFQKRTPTQRV
jgi:glycosyltransferase involved in cell wall biosynthesis